MCLFVVMGVYDIKHKIIPDGMVYTFAGLAASKLALFVYLFGVPMTRITTLNMFTPLILFTPFALLWLVSRGMWIGFGDAKLVFGIGALLGFIGGINAVVIAFWIGALWGVGHMILSRIKQDQSIVTLSSEVPFAPFLIIGTCIALFTQLDILSLSNFFHV
jgi:prepilin signal peptidase PulO-like enzyme (type II secretory pathway)